MIYMYANINFQVLHTLYCALSLSEHTQGTNIIAGNIEINCIFFLD